MKNIQESKVFSLSGWPVFLVDLILAALAVRTLIRGDETGAVGSIVLGVVLALVVIVSMTGFFIIHPNEAKVFTFFGQYAGTNRTAGFHWTNPFVVRKKVTLRILNFNSEKVKVNDAAGNPIEIAAVIVWHVVDTAKATFNVENYHHFVAIQSETAIRQLASHFPYDSHESDQESLRANPDSIAGKLRDQVQARLELSGVQVDEARISHLAYAPEIAQVMLRRQQAQAIIAARRQIVDGAVGMVEMALKSLEQQGVVTLDEEKKAAMVNNLLVALVSETEAQPIINTGTLYS
jgi:regulator of protease activity HflC (stomatin/prohibitin superfamily)